MITTLKNNSLFVSPSSFMNNNKVSINIKFNIKKKTVFSPEKCSITYVRSGGIIGDLRDRVRFCFDKKFRIGSSSFLKDVKNSYIQSILDLSKQVHDDFHNYYDFSEDVMFDDDVYDASIAYLKANLNSLDVISAKDFIYSLCAIKNSILSSIRLKDGQFKSRLLTRDVWENSIALDMKQDGCCTSCSNECTSYNCDLSEDRYSFNKVCLENIVSRVYLENVVHNTKTSLRMLNKDRLVFFNQDYFYNSYFYNQDYSPGTTFSLEEESF